MPDVIKGLECIAQQPQNGTCGGCAYFRPFTDDPDCGWCDKVTIANDALALLPGEGTCEAFQSWRYDALRKLSVRDPSNCKLLSEMREGGEVG